MKTNRPLLAVLASLLTMGAWTAYVAICGTTGSLLVAAVEGYDPRDLLAGHYLQFQFKQGSGQACQQSEAQGRACLCFDHLGSPASPSIPSWAGSCEQRPITCSNWLSGICRYGRLRTNLDRFYIAEADSKALARLPQNASVGVRLDGQGSGTVVSMYVEGTELADWLLNQP